LPTDAHSGEKYLKTGETELNYTFQTIQLSDRGFINEQIDSGNYYLRFGAWIKNGSTDKAKIGVKMNASGQTLSVFDLGWLASGSWALKQGCVQITSGTREIIFELYGKDLNNWAGYTTDVYFDDAFCIVTDQPGEILHVPGNYATIQEALDNANAGDTVRVDNGIYEENIVWPQVSSVSLISASGPENCTIDGAQKDVVIRVANTEAFNRIEGFTIKNGYANSGAGITVENCDLIITGNILTANTTTGNHGAGINCMGSSPDIINNTFQENNSGYYGGGIHCGLGSSPLISGNTFYKNTAKEGGGINVWGSDNDPVIEKNIFIENSAENLGGAIICWDSSPTIVNNLIIDCIAPQGSGIYLYNSSTTITNCTLNNTLSSNTAIHGYNSSPVITNCIIWPETVHFYNGGTPTIRYSIVKSVSGEGNIDSDPHFYGDSDYHLKVNSPCIDAGNSDSAPQTDLTGTIRPQGAGPDMGAYEQIPSLRGDIDGNDKIELNDVISGLKILAGLALDISDDVREIDINGDDEIGMSEILIRYSNHC